MKYLKISKYVGLSFLTLVLFFACKKIKTDEPIGDGGQQIIRILKYGSKESAPFSSSALTLDLSVATYDFECVLEYSSSQVPTSDVTVTLGYDAAALAAFNAAQPATGIKYIAFNNTQYTIPVATTKFRAGQGISEPFIVRFYPNQLDPSKSYMLPLAITNIAGAPAGVVKAPASSIAYLHVIGNALAGNYNMTALRYNYIGGVSFDGNPANIPAPASTTAIPATKKIFPIDGDNAWADFSNLGSLTSFDFEYVFTQVNNFASINVGYNSKFTSANQIKGTYLSGYVPPTATQKARFRVITHYNNDATGAGNDRIIDELFVQQ